MRVSQVVEEEGIQPGGAVQLTTDYRSSKKKRRERDGNLGQKRLTWLDSEETETATGERAYGLSGRRCSTKLID